jgi:hypothetical protein
MYSHKKKQLGGWLMDAQWAKIPPTGEAHLFVVSGGDLEEIVYKMANSFQDKKNQFFSEILLFLCLC